jgi:hypothetical protein
MKRIVLSLLFIAFAGGPLISAHPQTVLTGKVSGDHPAAEYALRGDVRVLSGKTLSFAAGSILRFESFSGITVQGTLVCKGTPGQPVLFTSANDVPNTGTAPEAFDWNGIKVTPEATAEASSAEASGITLEQCVIAYSTFGLNIESTVTPVSLTNVTFHHNGSASFTCGKKMMPITENIPASFNRPEIETTLTPAGKSIAKKADKKTTGKNIAAPEPVWKKPVRFPGAGSAIVGGALWLTGYLCAEHYNSLIKPGTPNALVKEYKDSWNNWVSVRNIGIGLFGLGAAGFTVTFVF